MLTSIVIAALSVAGPGDGGPDAPLAHRAVQDPYIEVWMNRDEVFDRGDRARVYFRTDVDAYVTIFRIDTDGRVRVLFPVDPWDDNFVRGNRRYEISARHGDFAFRVDDYPGQGYVFAVASADPFAYDPYIRNDHWDYRSIGYDGRVTGDPYVAFGDILAAIVPPDYVAYSYDVAPYFVERRYDYPRFVCYDCHTYAAYAYWNPYRSHCFSFRLVIYDDPYYYPARHYRGSRVVYRRRTVTVPRYVFKDRAPNDDHVVTVRQRPVDANGRRRVESGVRGRDIGGVGRVPAPVRRDVTRPTDPVRRRVNAVQSQRPRRVGEPTRAQPRLERRTDPDRRNEPSRATPQRRVEPERGSTPRRAAPARSPRRTTPRRAQPQRRAEPQRRNQPRARSAPSRVRPAPSRARPAPSRARPAPSRARPAPSRARPAPSRARPAPSRARPSTSRARPAPSRARPSTSRSRPSRSSPPKRPARRRT